jgi:DivIVA domain-containing protein
MRPADWLLAAVAVVVVSWQVADLLGPFKLEEHGSPSDTPKAARVRGWIAGWLHRPREPLSFSEWMPPSGRMFLPTFIALGLVWAGGWVLFGPDEAFRLGGALALMAGLPLTATVVGYLMRPVGPAQVPSVGARFPSGRPGYRAEEVDEVFERLHVMTKSEINGIQFSTVRLGYDMDAVDRALDRAAEARLT